MTCFLSLLFSKRLMLLYIYCCREAGIIVKNVDVSIGEIALNLNEELIASKKSSVTQVDEVLRSNAEFNLAKKQQNKQAALLAVSKYTSFIPEKVSSVCICLLILIFYLPLFTSLPPYECYKSLFSLSVIGFSHHAKVECEVCA